MAAQLDVKFFKKAKKVDRAIEITDNEAIIPAVKDSPEIRVKLPNRRLRTFEERLVILEERLNKLTEVEEEIEVERKRLLALVKTFNQTNSGASEVVAQNLKIQGLMEKRSAIDRPEKWIEDLAGLTLKDVFESKRDIRKIGSGVVVHQIKRRVEPISSLYIDFEAEAKAVEPVIEVPPLEAEAQSAQVPKTAEQVAQGVIIGRRTLLKKKPVG
jgi:hypothetical protein